MNREELIARLLVLPDTIAQAEGELLTAEFRYREQDTLLRHRTQELLLSGDIDGKNEAIRQAQIDQKTEIDRFHLDQLQQCKDWGKQRVHTLQNEFAALRTIARLLEGLKE